MQAASSVIHRAALAASACCLLCGFCSATAKESLQLGAAALFERSVTQGVVLAADGRSLVLARGELVEDDGPGAGYSYTPAVEKLVPGVRIRKQFVLDRAAARAATLLVARGGDLQAAVNGKIVELAEPRKLGHYWQAYAVDPRTLRHGVNEFVLWGEGEVFVSLDENYAAGSLTRTQHPNRSAKSRDGGATWDDERLGAQDNLDGEFNVRLFLDRYLAEGRVTSSVIDLGNLAERPVGNSVDAIGAVALAVDADVPSQGRLEVRYRTGTTFAPDDSTWTRWQTSGARNAAITSRGRYLQFEVLLGSRDPLSTPRLRQVTLTADPQTSSRWPEKLRITDEENPPVVRSSIPFSYEPFDQPALERFRAEQKLDKLVAGAGTELELIGRLATWASSRWPKIAHLGEAYPAWDAAAILTLHRDGTPVGGYCLQYNLVLLQACESFGIPGRVLSIGPGNHVDKIRGGHEVVELWSNQFNKWIYVDGNAAWHFADAETGVPLSLWELRQRQLDAWQQNDAKPVRCVKLAETRFDWNDFHDWPAFAELRLVPRSNFLAQRAPLPLNQGMRGWFWTGHYVWSDRREPAREIYTHRVTRRNNFEWTLNRAQIVLEPTARPGELRVHLDSNTPGLEKYLAAIDGAPRKLAASVFNWNLHPGANRLSVVPRNVAGREGVASRIELDYAP